MLVLPNERDDKWLQLIAREFNLSETAFLVKRSNTRKGRGLVQVDESNKGLKATKTYGPLPVENEWNLRWFTPTVEVHFQVDLFCLSDVEMLLFIVAFQLNIQIQTSLHSEMCADLRVLLLFMVHCDLWSEF